MSTSCENRRVEKGNVSGLGTYRVMGGIRSEEQS